MFYLNIKEEIQIKNSEQQLAATLVLNLFEFSVSSYSFGGNYSFLNLEIQMSQYIRPKATVHKCVETIQGWKLY